MRDFLKGTIKYVGGTALVLAAIGAGVYFAYMRNVIVGHNAMAPTILMGDRVLVWKTQQFDIGEVALCAHPRLANRYVMGRVVGRSGMTVAVDAGGNLTLNGNHPDRDMHGEVVFQNAETGEDERNHWAEVSLLDHDFTTFYRPNLRRQQAAERRVRGGLFLLSDNRTYIGEDSRSFGGVHPASCIGRVIMRLTAAQGAPDEIPHGALDILE